MTAIKCKDLNNKYEFIYQIFLSIKDFNKRMWSSLSFKQGTISKFSPPALTKLSLPWIKISSKVSTQSDEKPGQIKRTFLTPSLGKFSKVLSVYGWSHSCGPNLDWNVVLILIELNFSEISLVVLWQ